MTILIGFVGTLVCILAAIISARRKLDWVANIAFVGVAISFVTILYGTYQNTSDRAARCNERCGEQRRIACGELDGPYRHDGEGPEFSVCAKDGGSVLVVAPK